MRTRRILKGLVAGTCALVTPLAVTDARAQSPAQQTIVQVSAEDSALHALLDQLSAIGTALTQAQTPEAITQLNLQQAQVLGQIAARSKPAERETWLRQAADCLHAAALSQPTKKNPAYVQLVRFDEQVQKQMPGTALAAYVTYHAIEADYVATLNSGADYDRTQEQRRHQLAQFVSAYPNAEESPHAVLELAGMCESMNKLKDARRSYDFFLDHYPHHAEAPKVRGAVRRLGLEGNALPLTLPLVYADNDDSDHPFDLEELHGKVVIVYFWDRSCDRCGQDLQTLRGLLGRYAGKDVDVLCVSFDKTPKETREFLKGMAPFGTHVFVRGGRDGRLARELGLFTLPRAMLVGKDGTVLSQSLDVDKADEPVAAHLNDPAPLPAKTTAGRRR